MIVAHLIAVRDARIARAMRLDILGYDAHANRLWDSVERLTRVIEKRLDTEPTAYRRVA